MVTPKRFGVFCLLLGVGLIALWNSKSFDTYLTKRDLKKYCEIATAFPWKEYEMKSGEIRATAFTNRVNEPTWSEGFTKIMKNTSKEKDPYLYLINSAKELGLEGFECPALKNYLPKY